LRLHAIAKCRSNKLNFISYISYSAAPNTGSLALKSERVNCTNRITCSKGSLHPNRGSLSPILLHSLQGRWLHAFHTHPSGTMNLWLLVRPYDNFNSSYARRSSSLCISGEKHRFHANTSACFRCPRPTAKTPAFATICGSTHESNYHLFRVAAHDIQVT
jgi:hypothetical protein